MCKISIIVPVYNTVRFLPRSIDSVLKQSFTDFEVLIIDDGSTDGSGKICDAYAEKDSRIRVFHKENGGVSSARNLGLDNARGEWMYFSDSDDIIIEDAIDHMMSLISENIDYVMCGYEVFGEDDKCAYTIAERKQSVINKNDAIMEMFAPSDFRYQGYLWNKLFKASVIHENMLTFAQGIKFNEDRLFNVEYLCRMRGDVAYSTVPVYRYIERSTSAMASLSQRFNPDFFTDLDAFVKMGRMLRSVPVSMAILNAFANSMHYSVNRYYSMCRQFGELSFSKKWNVEKRFIQGVGMSKYCTYRRSKIKRIIKWLCPNS